MRNMPTSVIKWYKMWISASPESWDERDLERFYMFVHALLSAERKETFMSG
jgi:hypothetical protein